MLRLWKPERMGLRLSLFAVMWGIAGLGLRIAGMNLVPRSRNGALAHGEQL
jgi:hypothetical protein